MEVLFTGAISNNFWPGSLLFPHSTPKRPGSLLRKYLFFLQRYPLSSLMIVIFFSFFLAQKNFFLFVLCAMSNTWHCFSFPVTMLCTSYKQMWALYQNNNKCTCYKIIKGIVQFSVIIFFEHIKFWKCLEISFKKTSCRNRFCHVFDFCFYGLFTKIPSVFQK